jgi:hypothetical protein
VWKTAVPVETQVVECGALLIRESSTSFDHEGGNQFKYYCPDVGLVLIDGVGGPEGQEMAEIISIRQVGCPELGEWGDAAVALEDVAYNGPDSPAAYQPPNVSQCDSNNPDADCPNHEPVAGPDCQ